MEQKEKHFTLSWFFKWFLDNKAITVFLVTLLLGLNIFILSKISFFIFPSYRLFISSDVAGYLIGSTFLPLKSTSRYDGEVQDQPCLSH